MKKQTRNLSPFVREVSIMDADVTGLPIEMYTTREWRPWVLVVIGVSLISFCIWLWTATTAGAIH